MQEIIQLINSGQEAPFTPPPARAEAEEQRTLRMISGWKEVEDTIKMEPRLSLELKSSMLESLNLVFKSYISSLLGK